MTDIVERLRARQGFFDRGVCVGEDTDIREAAAEIEALREHVNALRLVATSHEPEALRLKADNERLRAALQIVREENDRAKRQFTNVSNKILDDACRALEPKP